VTDGAKACPGERKMIQFLNPVIIRERALSMMRFLSAVIILSLFSAVVKSQPAESLYLGTIIHSDYMDDASYGPYEIGFNFTFYGNTYHQFYVNTNGQVFFGDPSVSGEEAAIPDTTAPNNFIAALWDDLMISSAGKILYTTVGAAPNRKLIIQATNMGFYPFPIFMGTYLVILYETSNKIQVQYRIIIDATSERAHGMSATIGIENADGTEGVQYSYHNSTAISTGKAISFTPSGSTYSMNTDATYDGVLLTTNTTLPEPGIPQLLSPPQDAIIGSGHTFEWSESGNSASYTLLLSTAPNSDLGSAVRYNAGANLSYTVSGLIIDTTYFWGVFAQNATGTTWCEINRFTTSSTPPLAAVPQTLWVEQSQEKVINLGYTGGDASAKTAIITSLPLQGQLYQYNAGLKGPQITAVPATVSDAGRNIIYVANGTTGNGAGNFNFRVHDNTGYSPIVQNTIHVSPPGIPLLLYVARNTGIEMQFDKNMANPSGRQSQFTVTVNGLNDPVTSLALKDGDPTTIIATLTTPLTGTETVTISYTAGDVTSAVGGWLASFSAQSVTLRSQTITFNELTLRHLGDAPFNLTASASSGLALTYSSTNLSVATVVGGTVTIIGTGTTDITARQAGNSTYAPARYTRTLTVTESTNKTLYLTSVMLQGLYNGTATMRQAYDDIGPHWPAGVADHITVELHNSVTYSSIVYTITDVPLSTSGTASITIPAAYSGSYYITIRHRNSIETTTAVPVSFSGSTISQSFGSPSNVYGANLGLSYDGRYLIYSGDIDHDGFIGVSDMSMVDYQAFNFGFGYLSEDIDGDGFVGVSDMIIIDNNSANFIFAITP
jgi:hypothetical protein